MSTLITLIAEFGLLSGLGRVCTTLIQAIITVLYGSQYVQREDARGECQVLLAELQLAHQKLREDAVQAVDRTVASARSLARPVRARDIILKSEGRWTALRLSADPEIHP